MRVFVAGAAGAIGRHLLPQLAAQGHQETATAVGEAVTRAAPDVVIHQVTALAGRLSLRRFDQVFAVTNRLRTEGADILLAAALRRRLATPRGGTAGRSGPGGLPR